MPRVSVIIPMYNTERYVDRTFASLANQTEADWECIAIDDCSTDGTLSVAEQYAAADPRFKIIRTATNSGSAKIPIDLGVGESSGDFICLIGCDDYIADDTIEKLVRRQAETEADVVYLRMVMFDDGTERRLLTVPDASFDFSQTLTGKEAVMLTVGGWKIGANGALLRRGLLLSRKSYRNKEVRHMNADEYDTREMLLLADRVAFADTPYYYRQHADSITKKISYKLFESVITDRMLSELFAEHFGKQSSEYRLVQGLAIRSLLHQYHQYQKSARLLTEEDRKKALRIIADERSRTSAAEIIGSQIPVLRKLALLMPVPVLNAALLVIGKCR